MSIIDFTFEPELLKSFVGFGYGVYDGDRQWIPPLENELNARLAPDFWFYQQKGNKHRHFLANSGGQTAGRVTAMINSQLKDRDGTPVGTIGFFECIQEYRVAESLLKAATGWLRSQGVRRIWGPMNFDIWHGYRFMVDGFDQDLFYGEPYNKDYYPGFFERFGFAEKQRWDSVEITGHDLLRQMIARGEKRYQLLCDRGYSFEYFQPDRWQSELRKLQWVMSRSFGEFLGHTHISEEQLDHLMRPARQALDPRMFVFARDETGRLAGFATGILELSEAVRAMKGKSSLRSKLKFMHHRKNVSRINFYIGGVTPEEMKRRSGLGRAGFYVIINEMLKAGYETLLLTLRLKGNSAHGLPGRFSPVPQREYALYELSS